MKKYFCVSILVFLLAVNFAQAQSPANESTPPYSSQIVPKETVGPQQPQPMAITYTNVFAYCKSVENIDQPDARYAGPAMPEVVRRALIELSYKNAAQNQLMMKNNLAQAAWRCMDGAVFACNQPQPQMCWARVNNEPLPLPDIVTFCKRNSRSDLVPPDVAGPETAFLWRCVRGKPEVAAKTRHADARGFRQDLWYRILPPQ